MNIFTPIIFQKNLLKFILLFSIIAFAFEGIRAQTYTFTNAGVIGRTGPTQADINTAYTGTNLAGQVTSNNGIQYWVVPATGLYQIEAYGAQGSNATATTGGLGAYVSGEFLLTQGETIRILVGQNAPNTPARINLSSSGGGGSFVTRTPHNTRASILVIAGGGGGTGNERPPTSNATTDSTGQTGSHGTGGTNGNGATSGISTAGAGAGFFTDGVGGTAAGQAYVNGGLGGIINTTYSVNGGGFGGGGSITSGGNSRYAGGGGYSGGSGSNSLSGATTGLWGGGGASYNNGTNQVNTPGINLGHGMVVITTLSSGATNDIGVIDITEPEIYCPGARDVKAMVQNFGTNQVTSFTVYWSINGNAQTPYAFTGLLDKIGGAGSSTTEITLGTYNFTNSAVIIKAWTSMPNGVVDTVNINDTISELKQSSLPAPSALTVTALQGNQASFTWDGGATNTWLYIVVPAGTNPSGTGTATTTPTATVTGLTGETDYDFYVREVCPNGNISPWAGPLSFTTPFFCPPGSYCFYTCGKDGNTGPTQALCNTAYNGTALQGDVTINNGIQVWNVPSTGLYSIEAFGAQGGGSDARPGGKGAYMKGDFVLVTGSSLNVVVGQPGLISSGSTPAGNRGGGGGSFVWNAADLTKPLIAAGGGGGTNVSITSAPFGFNAVVGTEGTYKADNTGIPGTNGNGAKPGGAGFFTSSIGDDNGVPAQAIILGAVGGVGYSATTHYGGFGGGGGGGGSPSTTYASGGGGGYSGGAGQGTPASVGGGGGGSFNDGINRVSTAGARENMGVIVITPVAGTYLDAQLLKVTPITQEICMTTGMVPVNAIIRNYSTQAINNVTVTAQLSGATTGTFTQNIASMTLGESDTLTLTNIDNSVVGATTIKVFVSYINDDNRSNDSLTYTYTVNPIPAVPVATDKVGCNDQSVMLTGSSPGATVRWFTTPTGGIEVGAGDTFNTPILQTHTTYYAEGEAKGCISPGRTPVNIHVSQLSLNAGQSDTVCHDEVITLGGAPSATGSDGPFTYQWSPTNGLSSTTIPNPVLTADSTTLYTMTVTDSKGCVKASTVGVRVSYELIVNEQIANPCPGETNGEINLTVEGGLMPLSYNWSTGSQFPFIWGANPGSYTVTITDLNGCQVVESFTVGMADTIKAQGQVSHMTSTLTPNGAITLNVTGGSGNYTYNWSNGETTKDISGLTAGTYSVVVSDGHCDKTFTFTISNAVGIENNEVFVNLNVYPNPADNKFTIDVNTKSVKAVKIEVFDLLGRRVYLADNLNSTSIKHEINSSEWSQGTYMVKISSEGFSQFRKIEVIR